MTWTIIYIFFRMKQTVGIETAISCVQGCGRRRARSSLCREGRQVQPYPSPPLPSPLHPLPPHPPHPTLPHPTPTHPITPLHLHPTLPHPTPPHPTPARSAPAHRQEDDHALQDAVHPDFEISRTAQKRRPAAAVHGVVCPTSSPGQSSSPAGQGRAGLGLGLGLVLGLGSRR